jgi:hypothetical protein
MNIVHLAIVLLKGRTDIKSGLLLKCIEGANIRIATKGLDKDMERRGGMFLSNVRAPGDRSCPSAAVSISMPNLRLASTKT